MNNIDGVDYYKVLDKITKIEDKLDLVLEQFDLVLKSNARLRTDLQGESVCLKVTNLGQKRVHRDDNTSNASNRYLPNLLLIGREYDIIKGK